MKHRTYFCFGIGYVGKHWLTALPQTVMKTGAVRRLESQQTLKTIGLDPYIFDGTATFSLLDINPTHILVTIPPQANDDPVLTAFAQDIKRLTTLQWVGVLSSISVYGDHGGACVTETSPCHPSYGKARLDSEQAWLHLYKENGIPVHLFRLGGIYGAGRSLVDAVLLGKANRVNKPGHCFSRIHIDDIVSILNKSMNMPTPGEIYNLVDDLPTETREIIEYICARLEYPLPPLIYPETLTGRLADFYRDNKQVSNAKIKSALGITLRHPTYKEGLEMELRKALTKQSSG